MAGTIDRSRNQSVEERFEQDLDSLGRPEPGARILVAFSGGPDSTALLHLTAGLGRKFGWTLIAAHLDHGLRGEAGRADRLAAAAEAESLGAEFVWDRVDCRELADKRSLCLEEAAREARYEFLARTRKETRAGPVFLGHSADDNAEAVLMNLLRGSGPRGLAGIPPRRDYFFRPLLSFWRSEIMELLERLGRPFVTDAGNLDPAFTRNRIRRDLLPLLARDYNPSVKQALVRTARILADEESFWEEILAGLKEEVGWRLEPGRVSLEGAVLNSLSRGPARRLVRAAVRETSPDLKGLRLDHVEAVLDLAGRDRGGLDLPGDLRARVDAGRLLIGRPEPNGTAPFQYDLPVPGRVVLAEAGLVLTARTGEASAKLSPTDYQGDKAALDFDRVEPPLEVRSPRPGDRFKPLGLSGSKKLSDFFIDAKVPAEKRVRVPLVLDRSGVIWVGGFRPSDRVRLTTKTRRILFLEISKD